MHYFMLLVLAACIHVCAIMLTHLLRVLSDASCDLTVD